MRGGGAPKSVHGKVILTGREMTDARMPGGVAEELAQRPHVRAARVARLATVGQDGLPHLVPIVFVIDGQTLYTAVDEKSKRSRTLRRIENARKRPAVTVLVDNYEENWDQLWWVRLRGHARVLDGGTEAAFALRLLIDKYDQYRQTPPGLPVLAVDILEQRSWQAVPT
jgi:PPOX class probable F420-dependent enzyme